MRMQNEDDETKTPNEIVEEESRRVMGLDNEEFPSMNPWDAYIKLKSNPKLRRKINDSYVRIYKRLATESEYQMLLKQSLGITQQIAKDDMKDSYYRKKGYDEERFKDS